MHLKSLTLKGFKSFASSTSLKFEPGICAVVGPNGSGKSNVVDALAWVMGEHSAKTLRGGKMEDVIFAGAGERRPLGRAEVTLTIDNADQALPVDYAEVSITRRMFRDGASEYEINGTKARLMDIQELLSDTGIGREMHVIVGQGRLSQILESRPEDRRAFIEEAAGVLKHRRRKEKAQRKLTGMQTNLDRLSDLTGELSRQLKPLARQAEAAQRAATVQADLRDARLRLAGDRVIGLRRTLESADHQAELLREQVQTVAETLEAATGVQLGLEDELSELSPRVEAAQQLWFDLSTLAERVSATLRIATDRADNTGAVFEYTGPDPEDLDRRATAADEERETLLEEVDVARERLESIREEAEEREAAARAAEQEHLAQVRAIADRREGVVRLLAAEESQRSQVDTARETIERLSETRAETLERATSAEAESRRVAGQVAEYHSEREPLAAAHLRATSEATAAEQRLEQLRSQQKEHEKTVYTLQSRIETLQQTAPVADAAAQLDEADWAPLGTLLRAEPGVERALAAALGGHAEALAGELDDGVVDKLRVAETSRTVLLAAGEPGGDWRLSAELPAGVSWLLDHISIAATVADPVTRLLADVAYCPDLALARTLVAEDPRLRAVTAEGLLLGSGWVELGQGPGSTVEVTARIEAARSELAAAQRELDELSGTLEGARLAAAETRVNAAGCQAQLRDHDTELAALEREAGRLDKQATANRTEHDRAAQRVTQAEARLRELTEQLTETRDRLARVEDDGDGTEEPSTQARDEASSALNQIKAMEVEARLALRTAEERAGQVAGKGDNLRRQAAQERQARARHDAAMQQRRNQTELARTVAAGARDVQARVQDATARAAARRDELINQKNQLNVQRAKAKDEVSAARAQLNRLSGSAHDSEIARTQAQVRIDEAEKKTTEQLGIAIPDLLAEYTPDGDFDRQAEQQRLKQAEKDLNALGKVNPLALEEFRALEERYEFLSTQLADVTQARQDLINVIEDVDTQILQLFTDAWHDVSEQFPRVFATLFPGGEGRLVLTDPDDMLTTGIEVEARPPGKKVKRLSLLSGGEKSLTALAMLVAIFRARPSPFYVMDEVEAALDDVNLRRLIALFEELRKDSQLIVITHQKPTMDVANVLYGVTMRGDGVTRVISQRMTPAGQAPNSGAATRALPRDAAVAEAPENVPSEDAAQELGSAAEPTPVR
ncbi:chromosome segregation protein SMC [Corynebacterium halotolerans]|uniref:chromosome segregation protein SMC n=1 Tax=Corynebacterium halotolerans TaxID=225326 RepID=UPI003CF5D319